MVRPNFIPRTLRGVGGIRLFDIPGVTYPKEILITKAGMNRRNGRPYREIPGWGVTSREAAALLGCTPSSARTWLHRRKVPFRLVGEEGQALRIYWRKERVVALAENRLPIVQSCPASLIPSSEALRILHIGRSSLHRYQERGLLSVMQMRRPSHKGLRKCSYYKREEVEDLAKRLNFVRSKEKELFHFRDDSPPPPASPLPPRTRKRPSSRPPTRKM